MWRLLVSGEDGRVFCDQGVGILNGFFHTQTQGMDMQPGLQLRGGCLRRSLIVIGQEPKGIADQRQQQYTC